MISEIDDENLCEVDTSFYRDEFFRLSKDNEKLSKDNEKLIKSVQLQNEIAYYNGQITIMNYYMQNKAKVNIVGSITFMSMKFDRDVLYDCFKATDMKQSVSDIISFIEQYKKLHYNEQINSLLQKLIQIQSNEDGLKQLKQNFNEKDKKYSCIQSIQRNLRSDIDKLTKDINEVNKKLSIKQKQYEYLMSNVKETIVEAESIVIEKDNFHKQYDLNKILNDIKSDVFEYGNEYNLTVQLIKNFRSIDYIDIKRCIEDVLEYLPTIYLRYSFRTALVSFIKRHKHHIIDNYYNKINEDDNNRKIKITYRIYYKLLSMTSTEINSDEYSMNQYDKNTFLQLKYV